MDMLKTFRPLLMVVLTLWEGTNGQVNRFATCDTQIPDAKIPACYCDKLCVLLMDCCYGYKHNNADISKDETLPEADSVDISTCERIAGQPYNVSMVTKPDYRVPRFDATCRFPDRTKIHQALPVYDTKLGLTFRNSYCYTMYQRGKGLEPISSDYVLWAVETTYNCYQTLYTLYVKTEKRLSVVKFFGIILSQSTCQVTYFPPEGSQTRICFQHNEESCPNSNECMTYQSPVTNSAGEVFKNRHCAVCVNPRAQYQDFEKGLAKTDVKQTTLSFIVCKIGNMGDDSVCMKECNSEGELQYLKSCLNSFVKVRGHIVSMNIQIGENVFNDGDGQIIREIINRYIDLVNDINVAATLKTNAVLCRNFVLVDVYFRENIDFQLYLNMSSAVKQAMIMHRADIEADIRNLTIPNSSHCPFKNLATKDTVRTMTSTTDLLRFVIFGAVFSSFVLVFIIIVSIKVVFSRCKGDSDPESNDVE